MDTMRARFWRPGALALGALCLFGAGCGLFDSGKAKSSSGANSGTPATAKAVARVGGIYDIFTVIPNQGPLAGGNTVELRGVFPDPQTQAELSTIEQMYAVYFGANEAVWDTNFVPVISAGSIYVIAPPGLAPGFVDVALREIATDANVATLNAGYEYLDPYAITGVIPDAGPVAGGQQVAVLGRFPIAASIVTIAEADAAYRVYFDGRPAAFDDSFGTVISADTMYVITPPGAAPGLVDVAVATVVSAPESPDFRVLTLGYEYIDPTFEIDSADPDHGFICGNEPVTIRGRFPVSTFFSQSLLGNVAGASQYYSVYFGGKLAPFDPAVLTPVITATEMHVLSPPGDDVGLVDVEIIAHDGDDFSNAIFRQLAQAYRYYAMYLQRVIPPLGPVAGGTLVRLEGYLPGLAQIDSVSAAEAAYTVFFGGVKATFADMTPNPVFLPSTMIDIASCMYTTGYMYVIVPPGAAPGFVDVTIEDNTGKDLPTTLPNGYEYIGDFFITRCGPDRGHLCGGEQVTVIGEFPVSNAFSLSLLNNFAIASQYYTVYFGNHVAQFDPTVLTPVITATEMHVISPPGDDVGFVDVRVVSHDGNDFSDSVAAQLDGAYRYYAMYLSKVTPPSGPLAGGTLVKLEGFLPGLAEIDDVAAAEAAYTVYFGGIRATFANMAPNPVFLPSTIIDIASCMYTTGYMYVIAPPGAALGFVDVSIADDTEKDLPTTAVNGYEYIGSGGIDTWSVAEVCPNPVGKLDKGELIVRVAGTGQMPNSGANAGQVFIVPQGGRPANAVDRIALRVLSYTTGGGGFEWIGTNVDPIPRVMNPLSATDELLVDGHAAVYITNSTSTGNSGIIGDSATDPTDGGVIQAGAQQGRHFLIDTIPPRMLIVRNVVHPGVMGGEDFVSPDIPGNWMRSDLDTGGPGILIVHPYVSSAGALPNDGADAPYDAHFMSRPASPQTLAQVFFKVSSLTNYFADSMMTASPDFTPTANLQFTLNVSFEDIDVYTMMGRLPGPRDADFFGGGTDRQVAGFENGLNVTVAGLNRDQGLVSGSQTLADLLIWWDFQSTQFSLPKIEGITVHYESMGPMSIGALPGLSPNLASTPTQLKGTFVIGDGTPATGVQLDSAGLRTLMSVVFRAVDRAGDNFQFCNGAAPRAKDFTRNDTSLIEGYLPAQQPEMGPLNLWWLRTTGTRLTSTIPASGDIAAPGFSWQNTALPDPGAIDGDGGAGRRYTYAVYRTSRTAGTRDEQRDGPYTLVGSLPNVNGVGGPGQWAGWDGRVALTPGQVQQIVAYGSSPLETEGVWFLLVVMSADEAGNIEIWPTNQLTNISGVGPGQIGFVNVTGSEERNWARWFVPISGEQVDTRIEPTYWHDSLTSGTVGAIDGGEPNFGNAEVIPLPGPATFSPPLLTQRVAAQFHITALTEQPNAGISYEIIQNGVSQGISSVSPGQMRNKTAEIIYFDNTNLTGFLGSATRQPTYYTFRARTFIDANGNGVLDAGEIYDTSPATVQFVVVDNVAYFIQNRKSQDTQPIQEMDRP